MRSDPWQNLPMTPHTIFWNDFTMEEFDVSTKITQFPKEFSSGILLHVSFLSNPKMALASLRLKNKSDRDRELSLHPSYLGSIRVQSPVPKVAPEIILSIV